MLEQELVAWEPYDQAGVGEPVTEEICSQGIRNVEGINFTVQTKEELLFSLKIVMEQKRLAIPCHRRLCEQINEQQYATAKAGIYSSATQKMPMMICCGP